VLAGHPEDPSDIALPGMTRLIRITAVAEERAVLHLQGVVEDRSQLLPGESARVRLIVDRDRGEVRTTLAGREAMLQLV